MNPTGRPVDVALTKRRKGGNLLRLAAFTAFVLGAMLVAARPALAVRSDCVLAGCGFGAPLTALPFSPITGGLSTATLSETVFKNVSGVDSYVFSVSNSGALNWTSVSTSNLTAPFDRFESALSFGVVTDMTSGTIAHDNSSTPAFHFNPQSFKVDNIFDTGLPGVNPGDTLTFYAQARVDPIFGVLSVQDGSASNGVALDPAPNPAPEPSTALLLGLGFPMLSGLVARRRRARSKVSAAMIAG